MTATDPTDAMWDILETLQAVCNEAELTGDHVSLGALRTFLEQSACRYVRARQGVIKRRASGCDTPDEIALTNRMDEEAQSLFASICASLDRDEESP